MKKYLPICIIVLLSIVSLSIYGKDNKKEEFKTNIIKENDNKFTIAAYINGVYSDTMPTESKYFGYVECKDNSGNKLDTLGFVEWENNKWNVRITDITKASTCNVYFIDPPAHWLDAGEGTLLKAIKDNNVVENVKSIPGKQINKVDEAVLSGTYDDYGTSYFFRGNVQNNYVLFANKCWKIVRIDGNGNIKLWLWNDANNCSSYTVPKSTFNELINHNAYIGYMYGNINSNEFSNASETGVHDNIYDSTVLTNLKIWYDDTFDTENELNSTKYTDLLADVIWCGDKRLLQESGIGTAVSFYGFSDRKVNPTLVCQDSVENDNNNISRFTAYKNTDLNNVKGNGKLKTAIENTNPTQYKYYKVGLITADEAEYAGGMFAPNNKYYLFDSSFYYTMTPAYYSTFPVLVRTNPTGGLYTDVPVNQNYNMRAMVALNYNVSATYNTSDLVNKPGSKLNPYVVTVN